MDLRVRISAPGPDGASTHAEGVVQRHPPGHPRGVLGVNLGPQMNRSRGNRSIEVRVLVPPAARLSTVDVVLDDGLPVRTRLHRTHIGGEQHRALERGQVPGRVYGAFLRPLRRFLRG